MLNKVTEYKGLNLSELDWSPGSLIGLDQNDLDFPQPFVLTRVKKIVPGISTEFGGRVLIFFPEGGKTEKYTLFSEDNYLELFSSREPGKKGVVPVFRSQKEVGLPELRRGYLVETALSGEKAITDYLKDQVVIKLDSYADWMASGELITQFQKAGKLESLAKMFGFKFPTKSQLRFKSFYPTKY